MALTNCPECSKEISDRVKNCPHCGYPLVEDAKVFGVGKYGKVKIIGLILFFLAMGAAITYGFMHV